MDLILIGNSNRSICATDANASSSRSHAVLQIKILQQPICYTSNKKPTVATLSIIDLAGSERACVTNNKGGRLREALGSCINALCDKRTNKHIPYRNSQLTRLLKFSLGGNCKTAMIACVSPSSLHYEETLNTLKYASRAKNIVTNVSSNCIKFNADSVLKSKAVEQLQAENNLLKQELKKKLEVIQKAKNSSTKLDSFRRDNLFKDIKNMILSEGRNIFNSEEIFNITSFYLGFLRDQLTKFESVNINDCYSSVISGLRKEIEKVAAKYEYYSTLKKDMEFTKDRLDITVEESFKSLDPLQICLIKQYREIQKLENDTLYYVDKIKYTKEYLFQNYNCINQFIPFISSIVNGLSSKINQYRALGLDISHLEKIYDQSMYIFLKAIKSQVAPVDYSELKTPLISLSSSNAEVFKLTSCLKKFSNKASKKRVKFDLEGEEPHKVEILDYGEVYKIEPLKRSTALFSNIRRTALNDTPDRVLKEK